LVAVPVLKKQSSQWFWFFGKIENPVPVPNPCSKTSYPISGWFKLTGISGSNLLNWVPAKPWSKVKTRKIISSDAY
jgi:hypothetical protein